ncbi:alpha Duffy binding protein [Plasmodium coatneyi]|uniref:Alpha Duffy binding protein n=1 Tax=Plasmodium coatneyi TaxID=208452 RepID=A0A1B1DWA2_9APIC|nr:alpha Duffy binding protein [Plasmodium coatneyi]ANQ07081.1 alpha Duffy binding protein [Plasmodium coatneyi]
MNGTLPGKCENENVQGKNGRILATGHYCMEEDHIQPWLEGTDGSRIGRAQQNVKYEYGVTEVKIKDAQMNGKRTSRILKESTDDAQNVGDNNDIGEEANGEHKTDSKTDNGRNVNNLVMLDYGMSGSGHPSETLDNVPGLVTEHEGKSLRNSSEGGGHPYDMGQTKTMSSGVMNDAFFQKNVMRKCNDKRRRGVRDWDCPPRRDVCIPDRRYQLCMMEITNLIDNTNTHFHNDIAFRKLYLEKKLIYDVGAEGDLLLKKNNNVYNQDLCNDVRWSLEDFGDIIMGTDMESIGFSRVVEKNLSSIFGTDADAKVHRKEWWDKHKKEIWKAMMSTVRKKLWWYSSWSCNENVQLNVEPQIYRWIREWGRDYRSELSIEVRKLREKCDKRFYYVAKNVCMAFPCNNTCTLYEEWITRKKKQWNILSNKFLSVKEAQNIQRAGIVTAYDILKQEINNFKEEDFENEINNRDKVYIDFCICGDRKVKTNTQEIVKNVESAPNLGAQNLESTVQSVNNSRGEQARGDSAHVSVNTGKDSSTVSTGSAAASAGEGSNVGEDGVSSGGEGGSGVLGVSGEAGVSGSGPSALAEKDGKVDNGTGTEHRKDGKEADTEKNTEGKDTQDTVHSPQGSLNQHTNEGASSGQTHTEKGAETAGAGTPTPGQSDIADPAIGDVPGSGSNPNEGATPLTGTENLESNGSVHETTNDIAHNLENTNGGRERDLKEHNFNNDDMPNGVPNSDQTAHVDGHHRNSIMEDEAERGVHMNQDNFKENLNRYHLNSLNNLSSGKLDIREYKYRNVNAAREKIIRMSKARKCNNSASLMYCNSIEDKMWSSTCSKEERRYLCCSISDFCLSYFDVHSYDYHDCMKKEFEDPSYHCFTKGSFTRMAYFAGGGAFLILLLLVASWSVVTNDSEEATFNEFEEYCDNIHRTPLVSNDIEHMQTSTPMDYS